MGEGGGKGVGSGWPQASKSGGGVAAGSEFLQGISENEALFQTVSYFLKRY